jgi:hypothetical protein
MSLFKIVDGKEYSVLTGREVLRTICPICNLEIVYEKEQGKPRTHSGRCKDFARENRLYMKVKKDKKKREE